MEAKYKALEIANFYIQLLSSMPENQVDNLKLNKLLYYVQGWSLVRLGRPLFSDAIQAWDFGPVEPEVYHTFKCCGKNEIEEPSDTFDESRLSGDELELLIDVYQRYGRYTGWALKEMTHEKGGPWDIVYKKGENNVISLDKIKCYFEKDELPTFDTVHLNIPIVTELPKEWDSPEDSIYG